MIKLANRPVCLGLREMSLQVFGHAESLDLLSAENGGHLLVRGEILLVLGILEVLGLEVSPKSLDNFRPGELLVLLGADDSSQLGAEVQGLGESVLLLLGFIAGHFCSGLLCVLMC